MCLRHVTRGRPGVAAAGTAWYAADSLRHRRESGHGYTLRGDCPPGTDGFLRAAEALTGAPISWGSDVDLLINGDQIFPCYLDTIRSAQKTVCLFTYVYWTRRHRATRSPTRCASARRPASSAT